MAELHNTFFYGKWLGSGLKKGALYLENFLSGFAGYGWKIWKTATGKWRLEIDEILVRGSIVAFEQLVSKIRALKGSLFISQASGKIQNITGDEDFYYIVLEEDEMSFVAHDLIRCQNYSGKIKNYWVEVYAAENGTLTIAKSEFGSESGMPEIGDELAQCGNTVDTSRQSALYLHADENGVPAFDVLEGISTKSFEHCAIVRMGGILPGTENARGLWCRNGKIFCTVDGVEVYSFNPDGSLQLGAGQIKYDPVTKKLSFGSGVTLGWNNLSEEAQANLKGEKGDKGNPGDDGVDANLLPWVEEWNTNATEIGGESVVSPKMFSGTKDVITGKLTGIAMGRECITINNVKRTGIFALVDGEVVFELDPISKKYKFVGEVNSTLGVFEKVLRVKTTSKIIETTESEDLSDDTGFNLNYAVSADIYEANHFAYLPVSQEYDGTQAIIANIGGYNSSGNWVGGGTLTIAAKDVVAGDSRFATNAEFKAADGTTYGPTATKNAIFKIIVPYGGILRLWAFWLPYLYEENGQTIDDSKLYWRIENPADFYITKATVDYGATSFYILQGRSGNW